MKIIIFLLCFLSYISVGYFSIANNSEPYKDWAIHENLIQGYNNNTFGYEKNITRAEMVKLILLSIYTEKEIQEIKSSMKTKNIFIDINSTDWFFDYLQIAYTKGIIQGYEDKSIKPNNEITIAEAYALLAKSHFFEKIKENYNSNWYDKYLDVIKNEYAIFPNKSQINKFLKREEAIQLVYKTAFKKIGNIDLYKYKHKVYKKNDSNIFIQIENLDADSLEIIDNIGDPKIYIKDKNSAYIIDWYSYETLPIENSDPKTFEILKPYCIICTFKSGISKDQSNVYLGNNILKDLDSKKSKIDKKFMYPYMEIYFLYDETSIYLNDKKLTFPIDIQSFSYLSYKVIYEDKNTFYILLDDLFPVNLNRYNKNLFTHIKDNYFLYDKKIILKLNIDTKNFQEIQENEIE